MNISFLQGRNPFFLEPAIIIAITDGNKLTSSGGVQDEVSQQSPQRREVPANQDYFLLGWMTTQESVWPHNVHFNTCNKLYSITDKIRIIVRQNTKASCLVSLIFSSLLGKYLYLRQMIETVILVTLSFCVTTTFGLQLRIVYCHLISWLIIWPSKYQKKCMTSTTTKVSCVSM